MEGPVACFSRLFSDSISLRGPVYAAYHSGVLNGMSCRNLSPSSAGIEMLSLR